MAVQSQKKLANGNTIEVTWLDFDVDCHVCGMCIYMASRKYVETFPDGNKEYSHGRCYDPLYAA